ncbi:antitoxin Xre/MbcA/ParS toxin-binding domain-containing protein [Nevskia sp.]|uniref:antitoxin Xre/MbcA/ParS toxin-binding domain-containing protein n=1 Tax=Nevskia sp. TaxID=1929292 RepID=UPI0025EA21F5|nr:antitoxin Xre/MbcA/ParS toxin-binding domain-containing protein [Nevskia sp.]
MLPTSLHVAEPQPRAWVTPAGAFDACVQRVANADAMERAELEREGITGNVLKELPIRLQLPAMRLYAMLGLPKATAARKIAATEHLTGSSGHAAIGLIGLLVTAQRMVADSTADEAANFDTAAWLGRWLELPQPALGGRRPGDLIDTPAGLAMVARVLGAIESGSYQ